GGWVEVSMGSRAERLERAVQQAVAMRWMWIGAALAVLIGFAGFAATAGRSPGGNGGARDGAGDDAAIAARVNGVAVSVRQVRARAADRASFAQYRAQLIESEI